MIADKIRELRLARNMTQESLARRLGITRNTVNSWEQGYSAPSVMGLVEIAKYFNVSADYILGIANSSSISVNGLEPDEVALITSLIEKIKSNK
jgi:transcriptional regulator with XRE-family HTH domain